MCVCCAVDQGDGLGVGREARVLHDEQMNERTTVLTFGQSEQRKALSLCCDAALWTSEGGVEGSRDQRKGKGRKRKEILWLEKLIACNVRMMMVLICSFLYRSPGL
jgi:hypothetical protein